MAENQRNEAVERQLAEDRKLKERSMAEYSERMKGKPTPTQEENDRAVLGEHITHHEEDGSGPDPFVFSPDDERRIAEQSRREYGERMKGKPTPTQEENDRAKRGEHITEHEEDGSDKESDLEERERERSREQRNQTQSRHMEARPATRPASYQTRTVQHRPPSSE